MRIQKLKVINFGSYKNLELDLSDTGLALIQGPTGSGKSTIPDAASWVLFGRTAKDGNVDEVRSWQSEGETTSGSLRIATHNGLIDVYRHRGNPSENDLFWREKEIVTSFRGKDLADTQKLLEARLGITAELYFTGAYFHEFSPTASFFVTKPAQRRKVFEEIADLSFPVQLAEKATEEKKNVKKEIARCQSNLDKMSGKIEGLEASFLRAKRMAKDWDDRQAKATSQCKQKYDKFEEDQKNKLAELVKASALWSREVDDKESDLVFAIKGLETSLSPTKVFDLAIEDLKQRLIDLKAEKCPACGGAAESSERTELLQGIKELELDRVSNEKTRLSYDAKTDALKQLRQQDDPYIGRIAEVTNQQNTYLEQLQELQKQRNPHTGEMATIQEETDALWLLHRDSAQAIKVLETRYSVLEQLYDLSFDLRGELIRKAVVEIEQATNAYLEKFFDSEIKVAFSLDSDSLQVAIQKSGYDCVYKQLSKGQRGILKLCFVVAMMQSAANNAGVHFSNLFFDESLDGLDSDMKVKAYALFETLSEGRSSVMVIDHSPEFQTLFSKRYEVSLVGDYSQVEICE